MLSYQTDLPSTRHTDVGSPRSGPNYTELFIQLRAVYAVSASFDSACVSNPKMVMFVLSEVGVLSELLYGTFSPILKTITR